jgi:16S rRNA (cytosine967-C5)-methyltransferase
VRLARAGGTILYCTCSLQPEEGPERIAAALRRHPTLVRVPIHAEELFGFQELVTAEGDLRSLPSHLASLGGIDGFYAARLIKEV